MYRAGDLRVNVVLLGVLHRTLKKKKYVCMCMYIYIDRYIYILGCLKEVIQMLTGLTLYDPIVSSKHSPDAFLKLRCHN